MKPRSSLLTQSKSQLFNNDLKQSKSKTELNTPDFAYAESPKFCGNSPDGDPGRYTYSRKNSRNKTMAPSPLTLGDSDQHSPLYDKKAITPNHLKPAFSFNEELFIETPLKASIKNTQTSQIIMKAYDSLHQLRHEAKNYFNTSKKIIKENQKSRRSSIASEEYRNIVSLCVTENGLDPLKDLVDNINFIKKRVMLNELNNEMQASDDLNMKNTIEKLERKLEFEPRIDKTSICTGCNAKCLVF